VQLRDQSVENNSNNKTIVQQYEALQMKMRGNGRKFKDDIYPPVTSSLYLNNSLMKNFIEMFEKDGRKVEWMRLSELFHAKKMVLWTQDPT
jgi:lipid II:glycine glycyltransferase (peptidoglycan interpeptide bridge formation enzyme)